MSNLSDLWLEAYQGRGRGLLSSRLRGRASPSQTWGLSWHLITGLAGSSGASAIPGANIKGSWMVLTTSTREEGVSLPALLGSGAKSSALLLSWRGSQSPRGSGEGLVRAQ